jgi:sugar phosphate isomerase/epimerase
MLLGYNTNGFAHHRLEDAVDLLAELGCQSIALTLDVHHLSPFAPDALEQASLIGQRIAQAGMAVVVETGARFLLDPRRKHQPTLLDPDEAAREKRMRFLLRAMEMAKALGSTVVSFWSGAAVSTEPEEALFERLAHGCRRLCQASREMNGPALAFEPEPGMFLDTMAKFERLHREVGDPAFGLTLDIGHLHCLGEVPIAPHIERWGPHLRNVHIEDMRAGAHDHLPFGEGEINFPPVFEALKRVGYKGGLHVELSRHSHDAVEVARRSLVFLRQGVRGR